MLAEGEGFYLPALEAMALGSLVICPDCIGNRSFCLPGRNCFRPNYDLNSVIDSVQSAEKAKAVCRRDNVKKKKMAEMLTKRGTR